LTKLGLILVVAVAFAIVLMVAFNFKGPVFEPPYLEFILQAVFVLGSSIAITIISARAYLNSGSLNVLFLGIAILISGLSSTTAAWAVALSANESVTIGNIGIFISSFIILLSSIFTLSGIGSNGTNNRKLVLVTSYIISLFVVGTVALLADFDLMPVFLTQSGPTVVNSVILTVSILLYLESCMMFGWRYWLVKSHVIYWYSLALGLITLSLVAAAFTLSLGDTINWVSRIAFYLSGIYFLMAFLSRQTNTEASESLSGKFAQAFRSDPKQVAAFFSKMLNGLEYGKGITDKNGKPIDYIYLDINDAFEKATNLKKAKILGKKATEILKEENDQEKWIDLYGHTATTGEPTMFEKYSQLANKWFHVSVYSPQKGEFVSIFEDITTRKKAEQALERSEQRWATTLASIGDAVIATDADGKIMFMNGIAVDLTGYTLDEANQMKLTEVFHTLNGKTRQEADDPITRVLEKRNAVGLANESILIRKDGTEFPIDESEAPIRDKEGKTAGVVLIFRDISERKQIEEKLAEYSKNLEKLVEQRSAQLKDAERLATIGTTAGMVGHDIRNPLQAITGDLYLTKTELDSIPDSEAKKNAIENLQEIERNVDYINKIVADLQDFARPLSPTNQEIDLKPIIDKLLRKSSLPKNIKVTVKLEPEAKQIVADPDYINRILYNLVNNAAQAMPEGGKLTISAVKDNKEIVISVQDTGLGIPEEVKSKLFTPMFTTKAKGQGFGLAVVKRMTEALGGTVTFESQEGKGTTFTIRLPKK
jgi:PAS domain S-box-containing protein